jgi:HEAT repeat protein
VLFGLELAEKLDSKAVPHVIRNLLRHPSPAVRGRALRFFAHRPDAAIVHEITGLLKDNNHLVRAEAIHALCGIMKKDAIPITRPYLEDPDAEVKRAAIVGLLQYGNTGARDLALAAFRQMVNDRSCKGERGRMEAARVMGECDNSEFARHLGRLIREDSSVPVVREAILAAGKRKYPELISDLLLRLRCKNTKREARWALMGYGEIAVEELKISLFSSATVRDIRLDIPRVLGKIGSKAAGDALLAGLTLQDESIRDNITVALEEMAHRFPLSEKGRQRIESAMISEAKAYYRRSAALFVLFGHDERLPAEGARLLREMLLRSMEDARGRILRLLSTIYPAGDIQLVRASLQSEDAARRGYGIEFLDHLLFGNIKRDVFPVFDDSHGPRRFKKFLELLTIDRYDPEAALRDILTCEDTWLRAAAIWEIGVRRLRKFRGDIQGFLNCDHPVLKEAAEVVITRI